MPVIDFDDSADGACLDARYESVGVHFSRDDIYCVLGLDWSALGRSTTTSPMVLATIATIDIPRYTTHLNIAFADDVCEVSAWIGNDHVPEMQWTMRAFRADGMLLAENELTSIGNISVDELLHVQVPAIRSARIEGSHDGFAVVVDDFQFKSFCSSPVEIPVLSSSSMLLLACVIFAIGLSLLRRV